MVFKIFLSKQAQKFLEDVDEDISNRLKLK